MEDFPHPNSITTQQDYFGGTEVGVTHPQTPSFIKLADNGDIEIIACDGLGIILHFQTKTITLIADAIQFLTKDRTGLVWNNLAFNERATTYSQPSLFEMDAKDINQTFGGTTDFVPPSIN